ASDPDYVMMLSGSDFEQRPSFRAIWSGKNVLAKEARSTVFGFTSNLPPTLEAVRLRGELLDARGQPIRPAAGEGGPAAPRPKLVRAQSVPPDVRASQVRADGRVPPPKPDAPERQPTAPLAATPPLLPPAAGGVPAGQPLASGSGSPFPGAAPV